MVIRFRGLHGRARSLAPAGGPASASRGGAYTRRGAAAKCGRGLRSEQRAARGRDATRAPLAVAGFSCARQLRGAPAPAPSATHLRRSLAARIELRAGEVRDGLRQAARHPGRMAARAKPQIHRLSWRPLSAGRPRTCTFTMVLLRAACLIAAVSSARAFAPSHRHPVAPHSRAASQLSSSSLSTARYLHVDLQREVETRWLVVIDEVAARGDGSR